MMFSIICSKVFVGCRLKPLQTRRDPHLVGGPTRLFITVAEHPMGQTKRVVRTLTVLKASVWRVWDHVRVEQHLFRSIWTKVLTPWQKGKGERIEGRRTWRDGGRASRTSFQWPSSSSQAPTQKSCPPPQKATPAKKLGWRTWICGDISHLSHDSSQHSFFLFWSLISSPHHSKLLSYLLGTWAGCCGDRWYPLWPRVHLWTWWVFLGEIPRVARPAWNYW